MWSRSAFTETIEKEDTSLRFVWVEQGENNKQGRRKRKKLNKLCWKKLSPLASRRCGEGVLGAKQTKKKQAGLSTDRGWSKNRGGGKQAMVYAFKKNIIKKVRKARPNYRPVSSISSLRNRHLFDVIKREVSCRAGSYGRCRDRFWGKNLLENKK